MKPDEILYSDGDDAQPMDRLTRVADAGRKAMNACPDWDEGDKLIISINGKRESGKPGGGMFVHGYGKEDNAPELAEELKHVPPEKREQYARTRTAEIVAVLIEHARPSHPDARGPVRIVPRTLALTGYCRRPGALLPELGRRWSGRELLRHKSRDGGTEARPPAARASTGVAAYPARWADPTGTSARRRG
jgi:hypothetical protein